MAYFRFVFIYFQSIVHELEEIGSHHQIVFQYNDLPVFLDLSSYTIDDVACQSPILVTFNDCDCPETLQGMNISSHFFYRLFPSFVFGCIGINEKLAVGSKGVLQQGLQTALGVLQSVVCKQQDRGGCHTFCI